MRRSLRYLCISASLVAGAWVFAGPRLRGNSEPSATLKIPATSFSLRVQHVALSVANLERAARWYEQMLGFRTVASHPALRYDVQAVVLQKDGFMFELYERQGSRRSSPRPADHANDLLEQGYRHIAFELENLNAAVETLRARGAFIAADPALSEEDGRLSAFVADDSGNLIQLIQQIPEGQP
jgi:catechol 2,3-dioxygenase-like lactoylglutathione lyase family enzyme